MNWRGSSSYGQLSNCTIIFLSNRTEWTLETLALVESSVSVWSNRGERVEEAIALMGSSVSVK